MDRSGSSVVSGSGVPGIGAVNSGDSFSPQKETVRLLSYARENNPGGRFYQQQSKKYSSSSLAQQRPPVKKSAEKFFRTLRKRSKSATRLNRSGSRSEDEGGGGDLSRAETDVEEDDFFEETPGDVVITYRVNGERARNPDSSGKKEKVQLVGFAQRSADASSPPLRTNLSKSFSPSAGDLLLLECASNSGTRRFKKPR